MHAKWLNSISRLTKDNSPTILSAVAIGGVIATAILAAKATPKAIEKLEDVDPADKILKRQIVAETWKFYIPAGMSAAATIACIIGANKIGIRRQAAVAAAYTLVDTSFREYKDHVLQEIGEAKERKIHDKIMIDRMENNPPPAEVIVIGGGDQLCYDSLTGRYFKSDIEAIRRAENEVNRRVLTNMYASQNEFYELLGLGSTIVGDELGWNIDRLMELRFTSHLSECTGQPALAIGYKELPVKDYGKCF